MEINAEHSVKLAQRSSSAFICDATTVNWNDMIAKKPFLKNRIDYLSYDIDDAAYEGFVNIPWDTMSFNFMTIEHDAYRLGFETANFMRTFLKKRGYYLMCENVKNFGNPY